MTRVRNPFNALFADVTAVQDEVSKLFQRCAGPAAIPLPLDVWQDAQAVYVEADLPGFDPAKLDVTVTEGTHLTITGERPAADADRPGWVRRERPAGAFSRSIHLPVLVDSDKVEAKYADGVLRLTLPKHDAVKPRKIEVRTTA